jgi:coenzyme F420-reducing hydrogenase alpha subunit
MSDPDATQQPQSDEPAGEERTMKVRTIHVEALARVEGEGALTVKVRGDTVEDVRLEIFEPPRFFEAFLRGRSYLEAPDVTARICGICPVAYQMSAVHALEDALGIEIDPQVRALRRLLYCGEWIESHTLHAFLLHAPDFLGFPDAVAMAGDHRAEVELALSIKKAGNALVACLGGREIHPVNVRVGGFYRSPRRSELAELRAPLLAAREGTRQALRWATTLPFPECERDVEFVSLRHPDEYPMNEGRLVSSRGLDIDVHEFSTVFEEVQVPYSNALQARIRARGHYLTGPLARYNLNFDRLSPIAQEAAREAGLGPVCTNPNRSLLVRLVEVIYACDEAVRIIDAYQPPAAPFAEAPLKACSGEACSEAPRGSLYHRYTLEEDGTIQAATIIPPTSQNQACIEDDLRLLLAERLPDHPGDDMDELRFECERTIRSYDPCISCATHFLKLNVERLPR